MNADLKTAQAEGDAKLAASIGKRIKAEVKKTGGVFETDKDGFAKQVKATVTKEKTPKKERVVRNCPCCGGETNSYFIQGHDGRVHGLFLKVRAGKMKTSELPTLETRKMYQIWLKEKLTMRECAMKVQPK